MPQGQRGIGLSLAVCLREVICNLPGSNRMNSFRLANVTYHQNVNRNPLLILFDAIYNRFQRTGEMGEVCRFCSSPSSLSGGIV